MANSFGRTAQLTTYQRMLFITSRKRTETQGHFNRRFNGAENTLYRTRITDKKRIVKTIASKNSKGETVQIFNSRRSSLCGRMYHKEQIYEDNANRSFLLYLDESQERDEKIMHTEASRLGQGRQV